MSVSIFILAWLAGGFVIGTIIGKIIYQNSNPLDEEHINN